MSSFAGQASGIRLLVVGLASVVVTNSQVIEVVLPMTKQVFHILQNVLDVSGWDWCVVLHGGDVGLGLAKLMELVEHIVELVLEAVGKPRELGIISIGVGLGLSKNKPGIFEEGEDDGLTALLVSYFLVKEHVIVLDSGTKLVHVTDLVGCII